MRHLPGYQLIAFDPPGVGRSGMPLLPMTMMGLASVGAAVLDELGIESAHVLGTSFGGAVAQQMAFSQPRRVRRLVLVSTSFGGMSWPGNPMAYWHFMQPGSYEPRRLEQVAGVMFGGRMRTEPELMRTMHIKRPEQPDGGHVPDGPAARLDEPAVALGDPPADPDRLR